MCYWFARFRSSDGWASSRSSYHGTGGASLIIVDDEAIDVLWTCVRCVLRSFRDVGSYGVSKFWCLSRRVIGGLCSFGYCQRYWFPTCWSSIVVNERSLEVKIVIRGQRICSSAYTFTFKGLHVNRNVTVLLIEFISLRLLLEVCTLYRLLILDVRRTGTKMTHWCWCSTSRHIQLPLSTGR